MHQKKQYYLKKIQQFEIRLLQLDSLSEIIDHILYDAKNYFDLDVIGLCLVDELGDIAQLLEAEGKNAIFREGLVLLQDKSPLQSVFGNAMRPYIGSHKPHVLANFLLLHSFSAHRETFEITQLADLDLIRQFVIISGNNWK